MTINYTDLLKLSKPVQGTETGGWGDIVNDQVTSMVEEAIAGRVSIAHTADSVLTLSTANGATAQSRNMMVEITGARSQTQNVVVPTLSKMYIFKNSTTDAGSSGPYALTVKTATGSGVAVPAGKTMILFCDGTNVVEGINQIVGNLAVGGTTTSTGNLTIGANKLVVTASNGNTAIAGTLTTANGALSTGSGNITTTGAISGGSIDASPAVASGAVITGTSVNATTFAGYSGQRVLFTGGSDCTITLPDAIDDVAVGDSWVIVNAQGAAGVEVILDPGSSDNTINIATGSTYGGTANVNVTIAPGGVAELVVVSTHNYVIFGSGIS